MYLLRSFRLALRFMCLDSLFILFAAPKPHYQYVTREIRIWNMVISLASKTNYLLVFFLNFESQFILHSKFCECAGKMTFKIEFLNAPIEFQR